jgi:hypothetical protein
MCQTQGVPASGRFEFDLESSPDQAGLSSIRLALAQQHRSTTTGPITVR